MDQRPTCPVCDYDTTGLPSDTCPECGTTTTAEQFARWMGRTDEPATPWDAKPSLANYFDTFQRFALAPAEFVREYPGANRLNSAVRYSQLSHAIAIVVTGAVGFGITLVSSPGFIFRGAVFSALMAFVLAIGMYICDVALGSLLAMFVPTKYAPSSVVFWRSIVHYGAPYGAVSTVATVSVFCAVTSPAGETQAATQPVVALYYAMQTILILCWAGTVVVLAFHCRRKRSAAPWLVFVAIPLSVFVGFIAGVTAFFCVLGVVSVVFRGL